MALIEEAVFKLLRLDAGIAAIVSGRIYPVTVPQKETAARSYPAVVYSLTTREREQSHDGPTGLVNSDFEIDAISADYFEAKRLANAVRLCLDGKAAELQTHYAEAGVKGVFLDDEKDDFWYDEIESLSLYYVPQRYVVQHREALDG